MASKYNGGSRVKPKPGSNPFGVVGDAAAGRYNAAPSKPKPAPARPAASSSQQQAARKARERAIVASDKVPARRIVARAKTGQRSATDPWGNEALFRRAVNDARRGH